MLNLSKNIKRKAFTLAELLIALGVIGLLTAILMPIVSGLMPNQNALMAKKAYYTTETVISSLMNDPYCYPKIRARVGLDDGLGYKKCAKWGGEENKDSLTTPDSSKKLVTLFADKLDIKDSISNYAFKTKDGMIWSFNSTASKFKPNDPNSSIILIVDVNGNDGPNCGQTKQCPKCPDTARTDGFDRFAMRIYARGRIKILDGWAVMAAKVDKKLVGKEEAINCIETNGESAENKCE